MKTAVFLTALLTSGGVLAHTDAHAPAIAYIDAGPQIQTRAVGDNPSESGSWTETEEWPVLAVHAALLPTGKVLSWDATPDDFEEDPHLARDFETRVTVWDPKTNTHTETNNKTGGDLFCAGASQMWDGRVLFAGGDSGVLGKNGPLANSNVYNPWTNTWTETDYLNAPRWYSSVAGLSDGKMFTFGGAYAPTPVGETFEFNQKWREFSYQPAYSFSGDYAWLQQASDGSISYFGPHNLLESIYFGPDLIFPEVERDSDPADQGINGFYRGYGSYAMYDIDKTIIAGGGNSLKSSKLYDMKTKSVSDAAPMFNGRRQHNLTILADGSVLATGGNWNATDLVDINAGVYSGEIWNPDTNEWTLMADMEKSRQYHSVALLLPDARVLVAGGGYCPPCTEQKYQEQNAEVFSPPYLFNANNTLAARPVITDAPTEVGYGEDFSFKVNDQIAKVNMVRLGSVTHSQNENQRNIPADFALTNGVVNVNAVERNIMPPGHYMIFAVNTAGVPSEAAIVKFGYPLVSSSDVVKMPVRAGVPERFEVQGTGEHTLAMLADNPGATFSVKANGFDYPLECSDLTDGVICYISSATNKSWIVSVVAPAGTLGTRFSLTPGIATPGNAVATPLNVAGTLIGFDAISVQWSAVSFATGYDVYRNGVLHDHVDDKAYFDDNLQPLTTYTYQIVAVDANNNTSEKSEVISVAVGGDMFNGDISGYYNPDLPSPPTNFRTTLYPDGGGVVVWDKSWDDAAVVGYDVYRNGVIVQRTQGNTYYEDSFPSDVNITFYVVGYDNYGQRGQPSATFVTNGSGSIGRPTERPQTPAAFVSVVDEVPPTYIPPVVTPEPVDPVDPTDPDVTPPKKSSGGAFGPLMIMALVLVATRRRRVA